MVASQDIVVRDRPREQWVNSLRVIVIAGVIVVHAAVAYLVTVAAGPATPALARRLGWIAAAGVAALLALMVSLILARGADRALVMGTDWPTMAFALLDGVIAVTWTLWFTAWLRGRWPTHGALLGKAARASYATYVIHPLVLTAVMVLLASVALAPGIKFVLVAAAGVVACFTAGYALTRVPGISKVL